VVESSKTAYGHKADLTAVLMPVFAIQLCDDPKRTSAPGQLVDKPNPSLQSMDMKVSNAFRSSWGQTAERAHCLCTIAIVS